MVYYNVKGRLIKNRLAKSQRK